MKILLLFMGMTLFVFMNCEKYSIPGQSGKQSYQSRTNKNQPDNPSSNTLPTEQEKLIYVVAGTVTNEVAAIQAVQKFRNFGFDSRVFRSPNGPYIVTVAQSADEDSAQAFLNKHLNTGWIPNHSKLAYNSGWIGPLYPSDSQATSSYSQQSNNQGLASDQQNGYIGQGYTPTNPNQTNNNSQNNYIDPNQYPEYQNQNYNTQPAVPNNRTTPNVNNIPTTNNNIMNSATGLYYVVLEESPNEERAVLIANRYIQQGLVVFVYETTQGYKITVGKALSSDKAQSVKQSLSTQKGLNANILPDNENWKRLVYP